VNRHPIPLKFVMPGWFAVVMGLAGLALAWHRATPIMGEMAAGIALVVALVAAAVFVLLLIASFVRARRYPGAFREDFAHPVRHPFVAAIPISVILLATAAVALSGASPLAEAAWSLGSAAQLLVTVWVVAKWWRGNQPGGLVWASVTPVLVIPVVGNVLVPLAGVPLGHEQWSAAQFAVGLFFWPVVQVLIAVRLAVQGSWPERLQPSVFIYVAPPSVVGLAFAQFGAPPLLAWGAWGIALFSLLLAATQLRKILALPFAMPHWALSFPLAACSALTLRIAQPGSALAAFGVVALAFTSLVILALAFATLRGLRDGTLLAPEPVAAIQQVTA
jgi:tellurite resistance protein